MKTTILAATLASATPAFSDTYGKYETPRYSVEQTDGAYEVRAYAPALMAEVTVRADQSKALSQGFRILAGYIFGGNTSAASVAMTTPVAQSGADGLWTVGFMMPRSYTRDTLPTPKNKAIQFVETAPSRQVVVTFSGWASTGRLAEKETALRNYALSNGFNVTGPAQYLIYDDPLTLPWKRRNEVALPIN